MQHDEPRDPFERLTPPPGGLARLHQRIVRDDHARRSRRIRSLALSGMIAATAAILFTVGLGLGWWSSTPPQTPLTVWVIHEGSAPRAQHHARPTAPPTIALTSVSTGTDDVAFFVFEVGLEPLAAAPVRGRNVKGPPVDAGRR